MKWMIRLRQSLARSPIGGAVRALRLQRIFDAVYEPLLRSRGALAVAPAGASVRFRVTNKLEANRILQAVGEAEHIRSIAEDIRPGDVFYDIGANIGMFSVCVAAAASGAEIHAFEPEPGTASRLLENIRLNNASNVQVHSVAISDTPGSFDLFVDGSVGSGTHSLLPGHARSGDAATKVAVRVVDPIAYAAEVGIPAPTVVKCDVEGAEAGVLRGLRPWLETGRIRRLDVEFHRSTLEAAGESADALERAVLAAGYRAATRSERDDTVNVSFTRAAG